MSKLKEVLNSLSGSSYYSLEEILKHKALYNFIFGGRGNGKSYSMKKFLIEDYFNNNKKFGLIFREEEHMPTNTDIEAYFKDVPVTKITRGEYSTVFVRSKRLYLGNYEYEEKKGKTIKKFGHEIGIILFINRESLYKSMVFDVHNLFFEEFITRTGYLPDEPAKFDSLVSTVLRLKPVEDCKVFLVGNTISKVCPYFIDWGITKIRNLEIGDIEDFYIETVDPEKPIKLAVERSKPKTEAIGKALSKKGQQAERGEWETSKYHTINKNIWKQHYTPIYKFVFTYNSLYFLCTLSKGKALNYNDFGEAIPQHEEAIFIYVEPKTSRIQPHTRIIGDIFSNSVYFTSSFTPLTEAERPIMNMLKVGKIAFCDDDTGENFTVCYKEFNKRNFM